MAHHPQDKAMETAKEIMIAALQDADTLVGMYETIYRGFCA